MNTPLDGPTPLYIQIADILEARIADGIYPVNTPVPSVRGYGKNSTYRRGRRKRPWRNSKNAG